MKIVGAIFWENQNFFLCEGRSKMKKKKRKKKQAGDICKGILDIECEQDCQLI